MVDIMQILTWAVPSGGVGAAIAWIANRKVKQAEDARKIENVWKDMYDKLAKELLAKQDELNESAKENSRAIEELNQENARTRKALNRLSRAIEAIQLCPHRASCPVSSELQNGRKGDDGGEQRTSKKRQQRKQPDAEPDGKCGDGMPDVDPADNSRHGAADGGCG